MDELIANILYGKLSVEVPEKLTLKEQLEVVRACLLTEPRRVTLPKDAHPWVRTLYNGFAQPEVKIDSQVSFRQSPEHEQRIEVLTFQ
jgi:hypothetical protein